MTPCSGGIAGEASTSTITNSYNTGNISSVGPIGLVAGIAAQGDTVNNCYNTGDVSALTNYTDSDGFIKYGRGAGI